MQQAKIWNDLKNMLWDMMKRQRHDIGIGPQLATAFLAVALLTLSSGIVGLLSFWQASNAAQVLVDDAEMIRAVQEIRTAVGSLSGPPSDFIITGDPAAAGRYAAAQNQVAASIEAYESGHQFHSHSAEHSRSAETLITSTRADMAILAQLGEAIFASTDRQQAVSLSSEMEALLTAANLRLNELLINAEEDIQLARQAHASAQRSAYIGLIVTALLAFGLAIGLALVFTRSISRPLAELADAADRITAGDLSTPVLVQGSGEVGQLAEAFERMRLTIIQERGQLRLLAVLEERDRIGRQAAQEFLKAGDDKAAERQLQELVGAAREAYTDAREVIVGLRMNGVPERGLAELADEYVERFRRQSGVAAELVVASSWWADALPAKVKVQALRIIQEALTNARKHARASRVVVSLETENDTAVISVEDDGCGFMLSRLLRPDFSRYGLRTMRERAQAVGGSLRIESAPGKGTCIIAILPLSEAAGVPV
jgi:signal transduction histidine kinase